MTKLTPEQIKTEWLLQNRPVCLCKGIPRKRFVAAIKNGANTVCDINKAVGSGCGDCGGVRCGPVILQLLELYHSNKSEKGFHDA